MKQLKLIYILILILIINKFCYSVNFNIKALKIGPNPLVQGTNDLVVNYTSTTYHRAEYYLYSITGELIFYKKIEPSVSENSCSTTFTSSGTCHFVLAESSSLTSIPKQLYVLAMLFTSTYGNSIGDQINKKKYVIIK